jgi:isopentenyldiphosphate isomerase
MSEPDEVVALVDEQDNVIGQKRRADLTKDDCWRMVSIWIENSSGQVLLQQRSLNKLRSPGLWTPAAEGTVTLGDDYYESAVRELGEEIGLFDVELKPTKKIHAQFESGRRQMHGYTVVCDWPVEKFTLQAEEVEQIQWVDKAQVIAEIMGTTPHTRPWPMSIKYWADVFGLAS